MKQRTDLRFELFSKDNLPAACALTRRCFQSPWSETIYQRELENPQSVGFVCMCGAEAVGFIHCNFVLDELQLNTLCVAEEFRRQGIARQLFAEVCALMQGVCRVCYLEVRESNFAARRLYESLGFRQNGIRPRYYSDPEETAVLMSCELIT